MVDLVVTQSVAAKRVLQRKPFHVHEMTMDEPLEKTAVNETEQARECPDDNIHEVAERPSPAERTGES
jgi:hypothetical protein